MPGEEDERNAPAEQFSEMPAVVRGAFAKSETPRRQMIVHVGETRNDELAGRVNDLGIRRDVRLIQCSNMADSAACNDDGRIVDGRSKRTVDQRGACYYFRAWRD